MKNAQKISGFSLIEVMVVAAIVAIMAAIAIPSYSDSVRKSRRVEVRSLLMDNAQFLERFFTENNRYDQDVVGVAVVLPNLQSPRLGTAQYNITLQAVNATSYTLQAIPAAGGGMIGDACGTYVINHLNQQTSLNLVGMTSAQCWSR
jgi:type IV pilus assembly protein PilE